MLFLGLLLHAGPWGGPGGFADGGGGHHFGFFPFGPAIFWLGLLVFFALGRSGGAGGGGATGRDQHRHPPRPPRPQTRRAARLGPISTPRHRRRPRHRHRPHQSAMPMGSR
jgi:hypothetical protein